MNKRNELQAFTFMVTHKAQYFHFFYLLYYNRELSGAHECRAEAVQEGKLAFTEWGKSIKYKLNYSRVFLMC